MLAVKHPLWTDEAVRFDEGPHEYHVKDRQGVPQGQFTSVTTFIGEYFPKFDADEAIVKMRKSPKWPCSAYFGWSDQEIKDYFESERVTSSDSGTDMHAMLEDKLNDRLPPDDPRRQRFSLEHEMFEEFWSVECEGRKHVWRTEARLVSMSMRLAGSADLLLVVGTRVDEDMRKILQIEVVDFKRSKEIRSYPKFNEKSYINPKTYRGRARVGGEYARQPGDPDIGLDGKIVKYGDGKYIQLPTKGFGPARQLLHCNLIKYSLQGHIYAFMLENDFPNVQWNGETYDAIEVVQVSLLVMHPNKPTYQYIPLDDFWLETMRLVLRRQHELEGRTFEPDPPFHRLRFLTEEWYREKYREDEARKQGVPVIGAIGTLRDYFVDAHVSFTEEEVTMLEELAPKYDALWRRKRD